MEVCAQRDEEREVRLFCAVGCVVGAHRHGCEPSAAEVYQSAATAGPKARITPPRADAIIHERFHVVHAAANVERVGGGA